MTFTPGTTCSAAAALHFGQLSQISPRSETRCSAGPISNVVPESGIAPQAVSWPGSNFVGSQKFARRSAPAPAPSASGLVARNEALAAEALAATTEMPRKSKPQWTWPTEPSCRDGFSGPKRSTPFWPPPLKHIEKRGMPAVCRKPLLLTSASSSGDAAFNCFSSSALLGMPSPKMPSNLPPKLSAWSTISRTPFAICVVTEPTCTTSEATMASMEPLPKVMTTDGTPWERFAAGTATPAFTKSASMNVEEWLIPLKQLLLPSHRPASLHRHEGTMTESLPVSATTSNSCGGVPTARLIVKCVPSFFKLAHDCSEPTAKTECRECAKSLPCANARSASIKVPHARR
mmetsp:Transcript_23355/g.66026  ORF Transcript_23355/g.66026 Transcript_23355/m.66026 type:complete len:346 (-) Transcript_23355:80-1117(-)